MTSQAIDVLDLDNGTVAEHPADAAPTFDPDAAEAFAGRMVGVLNDASLALMISIGHQVELFDAMADLPASTSTQIAAAAGLQERYVREWLAAMTTGQVITYDPPSNTYRLPAAHAACLTRDSGPDNLSHVMQFIPLLASVEEPIVTCFRNGGGVPYSVYRRFHQLMAEDSATVHDAALIDNIIPLAPDLTDRLRSGIELADIGCGQGHAVNLLATAFPNSRFTGYDFSSEAIEAARSEAQQLGLSNVTFQLHNVTHLGLREAYDVITAFDAIHDQAQPAQVLAGIAEALRSDGVFLMVDIRASSRLEENLDLPSATFLYTASTLHCMTVSLALDGLGLGSMWGEQLAQGMLREAGFREVRVQRLESDPFNNYYIATNRAGGSTS